MAADWMIEAVRYYRGVNFFSTYSALSDEELAQQLSAEIQDEWGESFTVGQTGPQVVGEWGDVIRVPDNVPYAELTLLRADSTRVWWGDTEADVCAGNQVYVETLRAWSGISRGAFLPEDIIECWESDEGPISLTFVLDGAERTLRPAYLDDWIDMEIVVPINDWIRHTGYAFEVYKAFDQTAFVVVLTQTEKQQLARERGWRFA